MFMRENISFHLAKAFPMDGLSGLDKDVILMRYPFDDKEAVAPIASTRALALLKSDAADPVVAFGEQAAADVKFFIAIYSMPLVIYVVSR